MNPEVVKTIFEIGGAIVQHIWRAIDRGNDEELKKLADVWPEPIKSKLMLLAIEEKARRRVEGSNG